jgi:hypothetical protein
MRRIESLHQMRLLNILSFTHQQHVDAQFFRLPSKKRRPKA